MINKISSIYLCAFTVPAIISNRYYSKETIKYFIPTTVSTTNSNKYYSTSTDVKATLELSLPSFSIGITVRDIFSGISNRLSLPSFLIGITVNGRRSL